MTIIVSGIDKQVGGLRLKFVRQSLNLTRVRVLNMPTGLSYVRQEETGKVIMSNLAKKLLNKACQNRVRAKNLTGTAERSKA